MAYREFFRITYGPALCTMGTRFRHANFVVTSAIPAMLLLGCVRFSHSAAIKLDENLPAHHVANTGWLGPLFQNLWPTWRDPEFRNGMKWALEKRKADFPATGRLAGIPKPNATDFTNAFPMAPIDYPALRAPPPSAIQALWVGHATVLVQMCGLTFITDPIFSQRCSPFQFAGPSRVVPPAYEIEDPKVPDLDFVLISHNHYDHLDLGSVRRLYKRHGDKLRWYVPLGVKEWFAAEGITNVEQLDWWQEVEHVAPSGAKAVVTMTPAQHWTARGVLDRKRTLWGGYAVRGTPAGATPGTDADLRFWFTGDTGYCPVFSEIGSRLGPFDLSAIPIGAYDPRWFMGPQHVDPEEALRIHTEVGSRRSISIHCCTFCLTDEELDEPPRRLEEALAAQGLSGSAFVTLRHGAVLATAGGEDLNTPAAMMKC